MLFKRIAAIIITVAVMAVSCSDSGDKSIQKEQAGEVEAMAKPKSMIPDSLKDDDLHIAFVYAEERIWEPSLAVAIDPPSGENYSQVDSFFVIVNSNNAEKQYPVAEIGPPREDYDGKWRTFTVIWTDEGFMAHETVPILESYHDILVHHGLGHIEIEPGSPKGGPPEFFASHLTPLEPIDVIRE